MNKKSTLKPKKSDILDLAISKNINLKLDTQIKDSEYIVQMCENSNNAYLSFKRSNMLRNKEKEHDVIVSSIKRSILEKLEE
jgi:hypothetical protein